MLYINGRFLTQEITGAQRFATEICKELIKKKIPITILVPSTLQIISDEFKNHVHLIGSFSGHLWEQIDLAKFMFNHKSDWLLNLVNTGPVFVKNSIITLHDLVYLNKKWVSSKFHYYYSALIPILLKKAELIFTVSNFSKEEICKYYKLPENKVCIVPNAMTAFKSPSNCSILEKVQKKFILGVSAINPRKNFEFLIKAFEQLDRSDIDLVIVGSYYPEVYGNLNLVDNPNLMKKIKFLGRVSDEELVTLYKNAEMFIYPSLYEGFGIPPLEAMALGCPVIASNVTSIPEVCGDAALLIDPTNMENLVQEMNRLLTDEKLRKKLVEKGLARSQCFKWENSADILIKKLQEFNIID